MSHRHEVSPSASSMIAGFDYNDDGDGDGDTMMIRMDANYYIDERNRQTMDVTPTDSSDQASNDKMIESAHTDPEIEDGEEEYVKSSWFGKHRRKKKKNAIENSMQ